MMFSDLQLSLMGSLTQAVQELFGDYGVDCAATECKPLLPSDAVERKVGSVVGFRGRNLRGGLAFVAPAGLVARMLPVARYATRPTSTSSSETGAPRLPISWSAASRTR